MNPDDLTALLRIIAANPGTIIAATLPQVAAFAAAWVRIERRITRLETLIDVCFTGEQQQRKRREELDELSSRWQRKARP